MRHFGRHDELEEDMTFPSIVVINDDPDFLDMIQDLVADSRHYKVQVIQQGMGAVERLKQASPDVVVLDVRLEYDRLGYHVLEGMRRDQNLEQTPVIVCTADTDFLEQYQLHLRQLDSDWLEKPFRIEDLLRKIDDAIARSDAGES